MTTKIIYHQVKPGIDCPDGIAAAWVAKRAYPDAQVMGCWYQCSEQELPVVEAGDRLIIVDFSFSAEIIRRWEDLGAEIILIDHHKTAQEHLLGAASTLSSRIIFDMTRCGAALAWKYFFPSEFMPRFLLHIEDRDLWNFELKGTAEIHEAMSKLGRTFDLFDLYAACEEDEFVNALMPLGALLLKPKRQKVKAIADRAKLLGDGNLKIASVFLAVDGSEDRYTSDVCEELYTNRFPEAHFVQCITSDGTVSLRSDRTKPDNGFDVSEYAKQFGGGGHRNAAGFKPSSGEN